MDRKQLEIIVVLLSIVVISSACSLAGSSKQSTQVIQVTQILPDTQIVPVTQVVQVTQVIQTTEIVTVITNPPENTVQVFANKGWQNTSINVEQNQTLQIKVISGLWTHWKGSVPHNPGEGDPGYICANEMPISKCVEPLPTVPTGELIGKIGTQIFGIGSGATVQVQQSGLLYLRINDADNGLYDNEGVLTVSIIASK